MRAARLLALFALVAGLVPTPTARAQWQILDSHTTADLRGVSYVGSGTAWISGANGTVLRTEDSGFLWQHCTTPPGAEHLDFRGIQAFDNNTALVMSSGKGDLSRLYKTTDGCQTWTLVFTNPDKDGFWDALRFTDLCHGWLLGDPVDGQFVATQSTGCGTFSTDTVRAQSLRSRALAEEGGRGAFAASNSSFLTSPRGNPGNPCLYSLAWFGTSGPNGAKIFRYQSRQPQCSDWGIREWVGVAVPVAGTNSSSGVFSLAARNDHDVVAVGGDYTKPDMSLETAAYSTDGGQHWRPALTPPHGYRSSVAYDPTHNTWITVGPNGTDISTDDGRHWRALRPNPAAGDAPDADSHWNALSLPFVVGPHGRVGLLRSDALPSPPKHP